MHIGEKVACIIRLTNNDIKVVASTLKISPQALSKRIREGNFNDLLIEKIAQITDVKADDIKNLDWDKLKQALSQHHNMETIVISHVMNFTFNGLDAESAKHITSILQAASALNESGKKK